MRTTVELNDALVAEARDVLGSTTLRDMIETSLREAIRARRREALRQAIGTRTLALTITDEDLLRLRRDRPA